MGRAAADDPLELFRCEWGGFVAPVTVVAVAFADLAFAAYALVSFFVGHVCRSADTRFRTRTWMTSLLSAQKL